MGVMYSLANTKVAQHFLNFVIVVEI